tara:strand:+ start:32195 stop:32410 length:216 start_codon:yes stop_codon:yes gene_type:complete
MWGVKDQWNYYMKNKTPVFIVPISKSEWSVDIQKDYLTDIDSFTLNILETKEDAITFCKSNGLPFAELSIQ